MEKQSSGRGTWNSNFGFLMAAIGSAVGMGNMWGFPYKMGANGGLPFLLIYIGMVIFCGGIVTCVEMTIGRNTGKSPVLALGQLGERYKPVGMLGVIATFLIMGFYSTLIGYSIRYAVGFGVEIFSKGAGFGGMDGEAFFDSFTANVPSVILYTAITIAVCVIIIRAGIRKGTEKVCKIGIPILFVALLSVIAYNFTLPGSLKGLEFMFTNKGMELAGTDFDFFSLVRTAGGQMLFSLSLGMGITITYGSYLSKKTNISTYAWAIPAADTISAILCGLAIFPATFAMGQTPNAGPGLLFITLHDTFTSMGSVGNIVGLVFYSLIVFAGISSAIALMEVSVSNFVDMRVNKGKNPNRKRISLYIGLVLFGISLLTAVDQFGVYTSWLPFKESCRDMLDLLDFIAESVLMPIGGILMCLIVGWKKGMPWMKAEIEHEGNKFHMEKFVGVCIKYIAPLLLSFVFVSGMLDYFGI